MLRNKSNMIIIFCLLVFSLTSCTKYKPDFDSLGENTSDDQSKDSPIFFDVPVSAEEFREDYFKQMFYLPGGGGECEPYNVKVDIDGNVINIRNLPNKTIVLALYRVVDGSDCYGQSIYQFHSDYYFLPNEDGSAIIKMNLLPQDEFVLISNGRTLWKPHCMFVDVESSNYCE